MSGHSPGPEACLCRIQVLVCCALPCDWVQLRCWGECRGGERVPLRDGRACFKGLLPGTYVLQLCWNASTVCLLIRIPPGRSLFVEIHPAERRFQWREQRGGNGCPALQSAPMGLLLHRCGGGASVAWDGQSCYNNKVAFYTLR